MPLSAKVFSKEPISAEVARFVSMTAKRHGRPAHFVSDQARCFKGRLFRSRLRAGSHPLRSLPSASGPWRSDARRNLLRKDTGVSLGDSATPRTSRTRRHGSPVRYPVSRFRAAPARPPTESGVGGAKSVEPSSPEAIEVCARPTPLTLDQSLGPGQEFLPAKDRPPRRPMARCSERTAEPPQSEGPVGLVKTMELAGFGGNDLIARTLARVGWKLSSRTVGQIRRERWPLPRVPPSSGAGTGARSHTPSCSSASAADLTCQALFQR